MERQSELFIVPYLVLTTSMCVCVCVRERERSLVKRS
jgi:hypothetical protein